jgi:tetratricopeptide (TPR) repeat protein
VDSIRESGERGGLLLAIGTNFSPALNKEMGDAMELWNAHRYPEARQAFQAIRQNHPDSPWAAEAELHEACFAKFNNLLDEAETHFLNLLKKYPQEPQIRRKVLHYLPDVYSLSGRYAAAMDSLLDLQNLDPNWQERQYVENYQRIFARALNQAGTDRLCGTKALALALASTNSAGTTLNNATFSGIYQRYPWATNQAPNPAGYSLKELAALCGGQPAVIAYAQLKAAAAPGRPSWLISPNPPRPNGIRSPTSGALPTLSSPAILSWSSKPMTS